MFLATVNDLKLIMWFKPNERLNPNIWVETIVNETLSFRFATPVETSNHLSARNSLLKNKANMEEISNEWQRDFSCNLWIHKCYAWTQLNYWNVLLCEPEISFLIYLLYLIWVYITCKQKSPKLSPWLCSPSRTLLINAHFPS